MRTEEQLIKYLDEHFHNGETIPSIRQIREDLGRGSLTTITRVVRFWRYNNQNTVGLKDLPESSNAEESQLIIKELWRSLRPAINAYTKKRNALLIAENTNLREALDICERENQALKQKIERLSEEIEALKT